jgi:prephenate dehydrogenase
MLTGRTLVFCTDAQPENLAMIRGLFEATSADLVEMDLAEHDRRMAVVLGMTHLANLSYARALEHSGLAAGSLAEVAGVTFQRQLATTREVVGENPDLYFEIQALNELTADTADWLVEAVEEWRQAALEDDAASFARLMSECNEFLGDGLPEAGEAIR